ncbi:SA1362 family protein [Halobacillus sp. Marseille-Q1614]|uniref:SA1362 family protein n=1 Tax=Halobacillus sp. Marseille-Q1614 TaxID=2709134 RepID=UPI00156E5549|nr:SA1362 family protein [Halobacillus sp. Marseille-Q1614]
MSRNWMTSLIYSLIALAIFYVGIQLFTNTSSFLSSIIMMIGIAVLIYGALYFFILRHRTGGGGGGSRNEMKKYKQAVKQSKQKYKSPTVKPKKTQPSPVKPSLMQKKKQRRRSAAHLRVIEGQKNNKRKDRASF